MRRRGLKSSLAGTIILLAFVLIPFFERPQAATYYCSPRGSDANSGSEASSWATFAFAMKQLKPGDTLVIKDGTYYQSLDITASGTQTRPVTIRAANDGKAVIDGKRGLHPCGIKGTDSARVHDIVVEGLRCRNSSGSVFYLYHADRVEVRRVSAYDAAGGNFHVFDLKSARDCVLEDCAASGTGRILYDILSSEKITLRRCWGRWAAHSGDSGPKGFIQIYGSNDCLVENCVGTMSTGANAEVNGIQIWAHTYNSSANRNRLYGNVVYGLSGWGYWVGSAKHRIGGNHFANNVSVNCAFGFAQRGDADLRVERLTVVGSKAGFFVSEMPDYPGHPKDKDFAIKTELRNSIVEPGELAPDGETAIFLADHRLRNVTFNKTGKYPFDCPFDIVKYGKGGFLFLPPARGAPRKNEGNPVKPGAEVIYRYKDGSLTGIHLWPWPMEERIFSETGVSVTWEEKGGLWKTLDGLYGGKAR